ncbi:hypothetical protein DPMN_160337 [Dreissena polymorpha]|uniref:Uncharacterized protein n=1 Tax=Dreissena polymorpha TaxID=45954 RepID=A0A9D4IRL1_DREPO|nr:hypothetical protein DPMN_160337 [Dreissena polymorpha]
MNVQPITMIRVDTGGCVPIPLGITRESGISRKDNAATRNYVLHYTLLGLALIFMTVICLLTVCIYSKMQKAHSLHLSDRIFLYITFGVVGLLLLVVVVLSRSLCQKRSLSKKISASSQQHTEFATSMK